jgi:hypothetical protein
MTSSEKRATLIFVLVVGVAAALTWLLWPSAGDRTARPGPGSLAAGGNEGAERLSFLNMDSRSRLSQALREALARRLGPGAIEKRTLLDLELPEKGLLAALFPPIGALNRRLNNPPGERVEHDTVRLTYRHARSSGTPFEFVRLIFSAESGAPLYFHIRSKTQGADFLGAITKKYGQPVTKPWPDGRGTSRLWERDGDYLVVSETRSRNDTALYDFAFTFTGHLKALLETERAKRQLRMKAIEQKGQSAF